MPGKSERRFMRNCVRKTGNSNRRCSGNYILALKYHMVPEEMEAGFAARLAEMIVENEYKPDAGFMSVPFILDVLCDHG